MESPTRVLKEREVSQRTGLARSTLRRYVEKRQFPQPLQLTENRVGWLESEVDAWIASRPRARAA